MSASELNIIIPDGLSDRLDKALAALMPENYAFSRTRLQELIQSGFVFQEGEAVLNAKQKVRGGDHYIIHIPPIRMSEIAAEEIALDIVYEDKSLLVVNKPRGMVVHPAMTARTGTLVHALLHHAAGSLSGIGGVERPGIVHRIDKDTSGLLVVAKDDPTHLALGEQFRAHSIERVYWAYVYGALDLNHPRILGLEGVRRENNSLVIDQPIGRHKSDRKKQSIRADGRNALTYIRVLGYDQGKNITKIECRLETGRTHQIRVHLNYIGHALLGDLVYGKGARQLPQSTELPLTELVNSLHGQALHAGVLGFIHPASGSKMRFEAPIPEALQALDEWIIDADLF